MIFKKITVITSILCLFCTIAPDVLAKGHNYIQGNANTHIIVSIFDGLRLNNIVRSSSTFKAEYKITPGYYGVVFFTRKGFLPQVVLFKAKESPLTLDNVKLCRLEDSRKGVLTGVVYTPILGGKIKMERGIIRVFNNLHVRIFNEQFSYDVVTDREGKINVIVPEGEYKILLSNKDVGSVMIKEGVTTIKNLQKGLVLKD